ncbi:hypothetical protein PSA7680_02387 [Pseudoruegeria aquimaris]|uniref:YgjP-like metallopeptidase domain-containing protein n=1 Tax=Pseudoruegeria aquimaris TaxID=393663 RepID=A0A1Y5SRR0_9RHOB|nr:SprT family zinc-dependent metalloprotease [Pseudoruegeria aquimaris]SLN46475.1 hypothetical protein PSA7680_02387 [Pseudoruegeria aquimaris]
MEDWSLPGAPEISVRFRRSSRARRMSLRVSRLDGRVTLTLPRWAPEAQARDFLEQKAGWVRGQLAGRPAEIVPRFGGRLPVEGIEREICPAAGRKVVFSGGRIEVPGPEEAVPGRLAGALKVLARERLAAASNEYAARLGRPYNRLTLRDTRSRWGSCSSAGALMYSWRLILAPPEVLRYVAAHEVAHLRQMDHSPAFWAVVAELEPGYARPRAWLREHGTALHRYRFA